MGHNPFSLKSSLITIKQKERCVWCSLGSLASLMQNLGTNQFSAYRPCPVHKFYLFIQHTLQYQHTYQCCRVGHAPNALADLSKQSRWPSNEFCKKIRIHNYNPTITCTWQISLPRSLPLLKSRTPCVKSLKSQLIWNQKSQKCILICKIPNIFV